MPSVLRALMTALIVGLCALGCDDNGLPDAGVDRGPEAGVDSGVDRGPDAGDAIIDATLDAMPDGMPDAAVDAFDAIVDASDVVTDAIPDDFDAIPDVSDGIVGPPDAMPDAMPDASDAIPDAILDAMPLDGALPDVAPPVPDAAPPAPLLIVLDAPADGARVDRSPQRVSGRVGLPVDGVTLADLPVEVAADGRFAADVPLVEGPNPIIARAARGEAVAEARVTVVLDTIAPALTIDAPLDGALIGADRVAVSGAADDALRVTVAGAPAAVADGRYAVTVPLVEGPNTLEALGRDAVGNVGRAEVTVTRDTTAPIVRIDAPADGAVLAAEAVELRGAVDDPAASATLNGAPLPLNDGAFVVPVPLAEGPNRLTVVALDAVGNRDAATVVVIRDTTAPVVRIDRPLDGALVAAETVRVAGAVDDRAATLTVNGQAVVISPAGLWAAEVALVEGENAVSIAAEDAVGNRVELGLTVRRDTTPPPLSVDAPAEDAVVAAETIELRGSTEPGAAVTVGGVAIAVDGQGAFAVELPVVRGVNAAVVIAEDAAGNRSRVERRFVGDRDGPGLRVDAPAPGTLTAEDGVDVAGAVLDPQATVQVNGAPAVVVDGRFAARVALAEGPNVVVVVATDPAGNTERIEVPVQRDSTPPALSVEAPADGAVVREAALAIRGAVEAGAALTLRLNDGPLAAAIDGEAFSAAGELVGGANTLVAEARDAAGNVARVELRVTLDDQPPGLWIDDPPDRTVVAEGSVRVSGRVGDPAAAVAVGGLPAVVDGVGRFSVDVPLRPGANLIAAVSDRRATAITVHRDVEAPYFTLLGPAASGSHDRGQLDVLGRVVDRETDGPVQVWLGDRPARMSADGFVLRDVPLQAGATPLRLTFEDAVGNRRQATITVEHAPRIGQGLDAIGGLHQQGAVGQPLSTPLVVRARDVYGEPLAGAALTFEVIAGDGILDAFPTRGRAVDAVTDAAGLARVGYTLGGRAGLGAQRVRARGADGGPALGSVEFAPDALPGPAVSVVVARGQRQRVTAGDDLRFELRVTDAFGNPVADAPIAVVGLDGPDFEADLLSGVDGRAWLVVPTVSPGPIVLRATTGEARTPLLATAESAAEGPTRVVGRLIDAGDRPLAGLTVFAAPIDGPALATTSDAAGRFAIEVPAGAVEVGVDVDDRFAERRTVLVRPGHETDLGPWTLPAVAPVADPAADVFGLTALAGASLSGACPGCVERWSPVRASTWAPADGAVPAMTTALMTAPLAGAALCLPALDAHDGAVRDVLARIDGRWIRSGTATARDGDGLRWCTDPGMGPAGAAVYGLATAPPPPSCPANCDVGDPCTAGRCADGRCVFEPLDGVDCGDACRDATCVAGACVVESTAPEGTRCDDGDACTTDTVCLEGVCSGRPVECAGAPCSVSLCDPGVGCLALPAADGAPCGDGPCAADICRGGVCVAAAVECPAPDDPCLAAVCDVETGACAVEPVADGTPCGDAVCGASACRAGVCTPPDGAPAACDDGDACTVDDACRLGLCVGQGPPANAAPVTPDAALFDRPLDALTARVALLLERHPPFVAPFGEALRFDVTATRRDCCADGDVQAGGAVDAAAAWRRVARLEGPLDGLAREVELTGAGARVTVAITVEAALDLTLSGDVRVGRDACGDDCAAVDGRLAAGGALVAAARVVGCVAQKPGACADLTVAVGPLRPAISGQCALQLGECPGDPPPPCTVTVGPLPVALTLDGPAGRTTVPVSL